MPLSGHALPAEFIFARRAVMYSLLLLCGNGARAQAPADAVIVINRVQENCRQPGLLALTVSVCNNGDLALPANAPVSFYSADPRNGNAMALSTPYLLPFAVAARGCRTFRFDLRVNGSRADTLYAVVNDSGAARPWRLPNTRIAESDYSNNSGMATGFRFRAVVLPQDTLVGRGQFLQLYVRTRNGAAVAYNWFPPRSLSCVACPRPLLRIERGNSGAGLIAVSRNGCRDTAFSHYTVRPQADYSVQIDSIVCAGDGRGLVHFTLCDQGGGALPDSLPVGFYRGVPDEGRRIGEPCIHRSAGNRQCEADSFFCDPLFPGLLTAVVHDSSLPAVYRYPSGGHFDEDNQTNNLSSFNYEIPAVQVVPADTTLIRGSVVSLRVQSTMRGIVSYEWTTISGSPVDCLQCPAPALRVLDSSALRVQVRTAYGCAVEARARLSIFPPDFTARLLQADCYKNDSLLVAFRLCTGNGYDSVPARLPLSFSGRRKAGDPLIQLGPVFFTPAVMPGNCAEYRLVIPRPADSLLLLRVNDGGSFLPAQIVLLRETNGTNNEASITFAPFQVRLPFADTVLLRGQPLLLRPQVSGGLPQWVRWAPARFLDCAGCLSTTARPDYDIRYRLKTISVYGCTESAAIRIRTTSVGRVTIPNAFSPNGDGLNDFFYVTGSRDLAEVRQFAIYNRNGEQVMQRDGVPANDPSYGWSGNVRGSPAPAGTYVYSIRIAFADGNEEWFRGTVLLLR